MTLTCGRCGATYHGGGLYPRHSASRCAETLHETLTKLLILMCKSDKYGTYAAKLIDRLIDAKIEDAVDTRSNG